MPANETAKRILAFRSGDRCAFPKCDEHLTVEGSLSSSDAIVGQAAHIAGEKRGSPRHNLTMTDKERNGYGNLIYLCANHHMQIDRQERDYPVEVLIEMKKHHEEAVRQTLAEAFSAVSFPELEEATRWVKEFQPGAVSQDFSVINPEDKIKRNSLGSEARFHITQGLNIVRVVRSYIESVSQIDADFPERLKIEFLKEYHEKKKEGYSGEELFELMCIFAKRGFKNTAHESAAIAVLVYLFESCEVFEK